METETNINWFPGHMTKTRRMITANLSLVDAAVEVLDARIPLSSRNPEMDRLIKNKPRMLILNKADMADPKMTDKWEAYYRKKGFTVLKCSCKNGAGVKNFVQTVRQQLLKDLIAKREAKGAVGAPIRLMIVGIPNAGKSSLINRLAGSKKAKAEDRPGVTRTKQWVKLAENVELLDMPGVLWPKLSDQQAARKLVFTGAIKDQVVDIELLAMMLLEVLAQNYPDALKERYKLDLDSLDITKGYELLEAVGRKRGMLISGGEVNTERAAITVMDEYRSGKLGRITLDIPPTENKTEETEEAEDVTSE